jgi:hypothetical protein
MQRKDSLASLFLLKTPHSSLQKIVERNEAEKLPLITALYDRLWSVTQHPREIRTACRKDGIRVSLVGTSRKHRDLDHPSMPSLRHPARSSCPWQSGGGVPAVCVFYAQKRPKI